MRLLTLSFVLLFSASCFGQSENLLLEKKLISDYSKFPVYKHLVEDGQWKEAYSYLEDIEMYAITYLSEGLKVKGLLVKPKGKEKLPAIIYNRGGNREFGQLVISTGLLTLGEIAKEGYVVIASQYRGVVGGEGQEQFGGDDINDVLALIDVLAEIEEADTQRIGMLGWSRGGMMTYLALAKSDKIKAAAVGGAVSDLEAMVQDRPDFEEHVLGELIPQYKENRATELARRSALQWADQLNAKTPILILHGTSDWRVKPEQSLKMAMELNRLRRPYRLIMFEGGDHGISEHRDERTAQVLSWFNRYLKNDEKLPDMEFHGK
jgi:dipeptidyl aminopeptidase/acylaminoacyl peptidase